VLSWPITSFGLPVAMTTGRLVVGISTGLSGPAISAAAVATGAGLSVLVLSCLTWLHLRRRRASRHGSSS
jgi:hypothetical protein